MSVIPFSTVVLRDVIADPVRRYSLAQRIQDSLTFDGSGCWRWTGCRNAGGYGLVQVGPGKDHVSVVAHRIVYEMCVGPIPDGLVLDHTCRTKDCVNPAHLDPVTAAENSRRAWQRGEAVRRPMKKCRMGHDLTVAGSRGTKGRCRVCYNERMKQYRKEKLAQRSANAAK